MTTTRRAGEPDGYVLDPGRWAPRETEEEVAL
jgi:hypothetical protein